MKKTIAMLLVLVMVFALCGTAAFADIPEVVAVIHDFHNFEHFV